MYPATISSYQRPKSIDEVLSMLGSGNEDVLCMAGGMSLMQAVKARVAQPSELVDLGSVSELKGITQENGGLRIGAMTRYADIATSSKIGAAFVALSDAAARVGDRQVRNRGTIGGSICWNYVLACMPTVALGLSAEMELASSKGGTRQSRMIPAAEFFVGPLETARQPDELLVAVHFSARNRTGSAYRKWGPATDALPSVGIAISITLDGNGACEAACIAATGLRDGPQLFPKAAQILLGKTAADSKAIAGAFDAAAENADFPADSWASVEHKRMRLRAMGIELAQIAFKRAGQEGGR